MCRRHFRDEDEKSLEASPEKGVVIPSPPQSGVSLPPSVYDDILPSSASWRAPKNGSSGESSTPVMPFVAHLSNNKRLHRAWHRDEERISRGLFPVSGCRAHFETWEKQLVVIEIMLLAGVPNSYGCYCDLAHAWGRDQGFHKVILSQFFDRKGEINRKKRSDAALYD